MACKKCGRCCRYTAIIVDEMSEEAMRWSLYHNHLVVSRKGKNVVFVPNKCNQLSDEGLCKVYETRPKSCAVVPTKDCTEFQPPGCGYFDEGEENERTNCSQTINRGPGETNSQG